MPPLAWAAVGLIIVVAASVAGYGAAYRKGTRSARDHAKNIAENAVFVAEGRDIRHTHEL